MLISRVQLKERIKPPNYNVHPPAKPSFLSCQFFSCPSPLETCCLRFPAKWYGEQGHWPASWQSTDLFCSVANGDLMGPISQPISKRTEGRWPRGQRWKYHGCCETFWRYGLHLCPLGTLGLKCFLAKMPGKWPETDGFLGPANAHFF